MMLVPIPMGRAPCRTWGRWDALEGMEKALGGLVWSAGGGSPLQEQTASPARLDAAEQPPNPPPPKSAADVS